jgi:hypothetical protein
MRRDIEVILQFLPTGEGGRSAPVRTGYRPQFYYAGHDWDAVHEYPDHDSVLPGQEVRAFVAFLSPAEHLDKVVPGLIFEIREGTRVVARGRVPNVMDLYESAWRARVHDALEAYYLRLGSSAPADTTSPEGVAYKGLLRQTRMLRDLLKADASLATFRDELASMRTYLRESLIGERHAASVDELVQLVAALSKAG